MGFVLDWQKKLGYKEDPFIERPRKNILDFLVGREEERERLNLFVIKQERFGILQGGKGSGKTTLLDWLAQQLGNGFFSLKVVAFSGEAVSKPKLFFDRFLDETMNMLEKTVTKPHEKLKKDELAPFLLQKLRKRRVVIIVDDAQSLVKENRQLLHDILNTCPGSQVLLSLERVLKEHETYGKDELKVELDDMPETALCQLIQKRIELVGGYQTHPFDKDELNDLIVRSKKNPVKLLTVARDRAIELSLKVGPPPKPPKEERPKEEKRQKGLKQAAAKLVPKMEKKKDDGSGRFSIKFVDNDPDAPKPSKHTKKEEIDERILVSSNEIDADLLAEMVTHAEATAEEKDDSDIEVEDVIQSLVEELDEKKR